MVILAGIFVIAACQKELSVESGLTGGLATGTLKDSLGDCQPVSINGNYVTDSTLRADNYVYVQVQVTAPGIYRITTDQQNGFNFRDSGYFPSAGLQTVKLMAIGRPILPIPTNFTVNFGTSQCNFIVNVVDSSGGSGGGTPAAFTFNNTAGVCASPNIQGTYQAGTPLTANNTVTLSVNVTTPGTYNLTTTTMNGMTFSGSGVLATAGPATIVLRGTGTPTAAGTTAFAVTTASAGCGFSINVTSGNTQNATYTLAGAGGPCTAATVNGTYTAGTPLNATNSITVQVNVTAPGAYNMSTVSASGISFSGSGNFATTGQHNVTLAGSGTPTSAGTATIGVAAGTSACSVQVTINPGSGTGGGATAADSAWRFSQGARFFHGPMDTAYIETFQGFTFLRLEGYTFATNDSTFLAGILLPGGTITPGNYSTSNGSIFAFLDANFDEIYEANAGTPGAAINFTISSYNTTTRVVTGSFTGNAFNAAGSVVPITGGTFRAVVGQ